MTTNVLVGVSERETQHTHTHSKYESTFGESGIAWPKKGGFVNVAASMNGEITKESKVPYRLIYTSIASTGRETVL